MALVFFFVDLAVHWLVLIDDTRCDVTDVCLLRVIHECFFGFHIFVTMDFVVSKDIRFRRIFSY